MAKASEVQRESEGAKVLMMAPQHNGAGEKGPCFGQASGEGKREGVGEATRPKGPEGNQSFEKARELQGKLYAAAKQSRKRRFHALWDKIHRSDVLWEAWGRVRSNKGSAGIDGETLAQVDSYGEARMISELQVALREGLYRPPPVLRRYIPKDEGKKKRPLGIPTVRDRVAQTAAKLVLEPIFEADFKDCSYGYRPGRQTLGAMEKIRELANKGYNHVLDADIENFFGSLDQEILMKRICRRVSDRKVLKLLRAWLRAGVLDEGKLVETITGTPQGGVISPLLSNIYLHFLDAVWERQCKQVGVLIRFADDFVVMCKNAKAVEEAERRIKLVLGRLRLKLNPEKTRKVDLSYGKEGFNFLGWYARKRMSGRLKEQKGKVLYFLQRWPSDRSMRRVRHRVRELVGPSRNGVKDVKVLIKGLNPLLRGWGNYFRTGNSADKFQSVDQHVWDRLLKFQNRRYRRNLKPGQAKAWTQDWFQEMGLHVLRGTIRYPGVVHATA